jgi:DASS family divalent anion:Na+ symporter
MFWFYASSVTGAIMLLGYFFTSFIFFRSFNKVTVSKEDIKEQWRSLDKLNWFEWSALLGIAFLTIGIFTTSLHKIPLQVISLSTICSLLVIGALSRDDFIKSIDWAFLFLLASMIGIMSCMSYMGLDKNLIAQLGWLKDSMRDNFPLFVLALTGAILLVRLFIPLNSAILIFAAALLPLASGAGISPWVVGFIILIISETAFFGYQSPYILLFRNLVKDHVNYSERKVQLFHGVLIFIKVGAIYASIPFWHAIGVL